MEERQAELEQLPELTEEPEEQPEQDDELLTEEELEDARTVAELDEKIAHLDEQLEKFKAESLTDKKREAMRKMSYNDSQIERYIAMIKGETEDEINASVIELSYEIPPAQDNYADPSAMNGAKQKMRSNPHERGLELGRKIAKRLIKKGAIR